MTVRIAAWSGPRNISTAMMRAWDSRGDCAVSDEPLYAPYLAATGLDHPGRDDVVAAGRAADGLDWRRVVAALADGPAPGGRPLWYQKHMAHHLLPGMDSGWVQRVVNVFLIRDPALVVASYVRSRAGVAPADIGLLQQAELFDAAADRLGTAPPVIDAERFLRDPAGQLQSLCRDIGVPWTERMLRWEPGPRASDGVWAPHWYAAVWRSSGFEPPRERTPLLSPHDAGVADACRPAYDRLLRFAY